VGGGDLAGGGEVARGRDDDPVLALDRLQHHHRRRRGDGGRQRVHVAVRDVDDLARQRPERVRLGRLAGERERPHRAAVEAADRRHHLGPAGAAGQLERRLVGLRARVGEEHPPGPARAGQQLLGQGGRGLGGVQVGHVAQPRDLRADRLDHRRVGVPEQVDRDPAQHVHIGLSGVVPDDRALAAHQSDRRRAVRVHHAAVHRFVSRS
jgi:hypothetical protein